MMETPEESTWDYYIELASALQNVSNEQRDRIKNSVITLRDILGEDWLKPAFEKHHPIIWYLKYICFV